MLDETMRRLRFWLARKLVGDIGPCVVMPPAMFGSVMHGVVLPGHGLPQRSMVTMSKSNAVPTAQIVQVEMYDPTR